MSDVIVKFHENEQIADELLKFAVIMARHENKWVFCRHKERDTYEIPGGHRETGALRFSIEPVCVYSVTRGEVTTFGKLYFSEIYEIGSLLPKSEIVRIEAMFGATKRTNANNCGK